MSRERHRYQGGLGAGREDTVPNPAVTAAWLAYYRATSLPAGATAVGASDVGPPVVEPWPRDTDICSGGASFDLAGDSSGNTSRYMTNAAAEAGLKNTTRMGSTTGTSGACGIVSGADLTSLRACASGSLAIFLRLFTVGDVLFFGATSQYGNRFLMGGCRSNGSLYLELNTPQGAGSGTYEYWQSAETGIVTTGHHAIAFSQTGDGAADNPMIGYVDGEPYELVHNEGTATGFADKLHWIADVDNTGTGIDAVCLGARVDDSNPFVITYGTDAYWFDAGLTVNGSVLGANSAQLLASIQHAYYGK